MSKPALTPMENARIERPSADTTARCSLDQKLRDLGYTIKRRPKVGKAIWEKNGVEFEQDELRRRENL